MTSNHSCLNCFWAVTGPQYDKRVLPGVNTSKVGIISSIAGSYLSLFLPG